MSESKIIFSESANIFEEGLLSGKIVRDTAPNNYYDFKGEIVHDYALKYMSFVQTQYNDVIVNTDQDQNDNIFNIFGSNK